MHRFLLVVLLLLLPISAVAEVTLTLGWERPVRFKVVDAETGEAVARPLLIVATEKEYEGAPQPVKTFEVLRGGESGTVDYKASEKVRGVELRLTAPGYAYLIKQVSWQQLPPRQRDKEGFDLGPPPVIELALKNLERSGDWKREFRISIGPALEEYLALGPPAMSREGKKLIADFLNKERDKLLGF